MRRGPDIHIHIDKKMRYLTIIAMFLFCIQINTTGQSRIVKDFMPACDSLAERLSERSGVDGKLKLKAVMKRGKALDFYFTETLSDFPLYNGDVKWLRQNLKGLFPENYSGYSLGVIYTRQTNVEKLQMPRLGSSGKPVKNDYRISVQGKQAPIVTSLGTIQFTKGMANRHIALWQSHGRYYDQTADKWQWQRPCMFQTCEDMFTQGFVLPYLVPMLENAGAYVLLPRERDTQVNEVIIDNNPTCGVRGAGKYHETGKWQDAGSGFADSKEIYFDKENPFTAGTSRQIQCAGPKSNARATASWTPEIPQRGEYAVYVSYKTLRNSTSAAHYTVTHLGGKSEFIVNQKMGGGTWVYLGTFEFEKGTSGGVSLDNKLLEGHSYEIGTVVTADAVRFGGGMGNIARGASVTSEEEIVSEPVISGLPRYAEGARYYLQWSGADSTIYYQNDGNHDYRDDFMSRGDWVEWISRGSDINPRTDGGLKIPVDLSLGFHSDAGVTPDDSIVGTLAIYTHRSEGKTKLPSGEDRLTSRMYADIVQSQIVNDLRHGYDSLWTRRSLWDRSYRESRTPSCPAMLLELLSHQNFADMRFGHDPSFKFTVSRAVYKGMLKYLSNRYGCDYAVQPLPVSHIGVEFGDGATAVVSWKPVMDPLEQTAAPSGYIVYRRTADGGFDNGTKVKAEPDGNGYIHYKTKITGGEITSFKVRAYNDGGLSFPSETVSIGMPANAPKGGTVLIVNNFDRVSGPSSFDSGSRAGFDNRHDSGVSYIKDITFVGEMYDFRRKSEWVSNDSPGFGASYPDMAGEIVAGNTFDYTPIHGKAILEAGHPYISCSNERFSSDTLICSGIWAIDLICGKQMSTTLGKETRHEVFPDALQEAIIKFTQEGGNMIISGAYIGSDQSTANHKTFINKTLGYKHAASNATRRGAAKPYPCPDMPAMPDIQIVMDQNSDIYCVESPDGITPAAKSGRIIFRYSDSGISAGVAYKGDGYKCVIFGFPLETLKTPEMTTNLIINSLEYFKR